MIETFGTKLNNKEMIQKNLGIMKHYRPNQLLYKQRLRLSNVQHIKMRVLTYGGVTVVAFDVLSALQAD